MPRTRPKSVSSAEVLSTGSSDSGLESDVLSAFSLADAGKVEISEERKFKFGADIADVDRMTNLQTALSWVRDELQMMKSQDKQLARTLIDVRSRIQEVRLELETLRDTGYDSDELEMLQKHDKRNASSQNDLSSLSSEFPVNSSNFENNKRATWAI